jgi:alpha-amylase
MRFKEINFAILCLTIFLLNPTVNAQNDVMLQAFYWNVPVDKKNNNGSWWNNLTNKANELKSSGFTAIWIPPPSKGNWGIEDNGYGIYDYYDLGNYYQKGTTETRFGSKSELINMLNKMHQSPKIDVYADAVLNHLYGSDENLESNPAVKKYVFDNACRNGIQFAPYQCNEITWVIPNAQPGDYFIQIKGYCLNWNDFKQRGYDIYINWTGEEYNTNFIWEHEPNNGNGSFNTFPGSGKTIRAHIDYQTDVDEYKVTISSAHDLILIITAKQEGQDAKGNWEWQWTDQMKGYYPFTVYYKGNDIAGSVLEARTRSNLFFVNHTGNGEPNYSWHYNNFHPSDDSDYLQWPGNDEVIPNCKLFGNDLNTFNPVVQTRLKDWGYWLADQIGFDGFRLDFVRGYQESFIADWIKNLPKLNGSQSFIVGEYWGADYRIKDWVNTLAGLGADADAFDFPLQQTLKDMCNGDQNSFNMTRLNHAGMVRNNSGNNLPRTAVVTFAENHDTGKEPDKWITKDFKMAYAYILTHEGRPCIFYPHFYGIRELPADDKLKESVKAPASLKNEIKKLIFIRKTYLGGIISVLSETGNPYPASDVENVYVARRQGNGDKDGAIIVINNHNTETKEIWVDSSPEGFSNWAGLKLRNTIDPSQIIHVENDGRVKVFAPPRGYSIWVKQSDYTSFKK